MNGKYVTKYVVEGSRGGHVQGIATDKDNEYMYFSFTTELLKVNREGIVVGSVKGLAGHLGCIAMNYENGKVYGSLEFKRDSIGKGVLKSVGRCDELEDGFYIAVFDVDKIDRMDMDAEKDGIMTAVYLKEVFDDYSTENHRYGCSGIDGTTFAPDFASNSGKYYLYVAYGIYNDLNRTDNDNQVILRYDTENWDSYAKPLNQLCMHKSGPEEPDGKYFLFTGNTDWGVQNLEYDKEHNVIAAAVYKGFKEQYPNFDMYFIDMNKKPETKLIKGTNEMKSEIFLAEIGEKDEKTGQYGSRFPLGSTGMISLGSGLWYFSHSYKKDGTHCSLVELYKYTDSGEVFEKV